MEYKSTSTLEVKDLDRTSRTAVIAHAVYDNIDRTRDISRKGMFTKSWSENPDVSFYLNHNEDQSPGWTTKLYEDEQKAYTVVKFGTHTLGNDTLIMVDEGTIKRASFGYITQKKNDITVKGTKVRELKEVSHLETSVLTKIAANAKAGIVSVTKSLELENVVRELKEHLDVMERFCRNTKASDQTIISVLNEIQEAKSIISAYDTAFTPLITEPTASSEENDSEAKAEEFCKRLLLFNQQLSIN